MIEKHVLVQNQKIPYTLKKSKKARNIRLSVDIDGTVVVTMPFFLREKSAERFVKQKGKLYEVKKED